jgi:hypothetical protein
MTPVDIRNETWASIQERLTSDRRKVWEAYLMYGPCTTADLAARCGMDKLTVRPRTTELYDLMLVELVGKKGHEGIYGHVPAHIARARFLKAQSEILKPTSNPNQLKMAFA